MLFVNEISDFMGSNLTEKQFEKLTGFTGQWDADAFSAGEMLTIIHTANLLHERNARPVPHMLNYMEMLTTFAESDHDRRHYRVWQGAFPDLLENQNLSLRRINDLMLFINGLISDNTLYKSDAISWKSSVPDFSLVFNDSLQIVFPETILKGFNHIDTLTIFTTAGVLYPLSRTWMGKGGRVTWERTGLDETEAYAILDNYEIELGRSEYHADSVLFHFSPYFNTPIAGRLTDRVMTSGNNSAAGYPRFRSYGQDFNIRGIYRNIDYEGGLSMQGARLIGSGGENGEASLIFYRDNEKLLTASSDHFVFNSQGASSVSASIILHLEDEMVFHPDLQLNYIERSRELSLSRNERIMSQSPWYNQFHQVDMSFAQLLWKIDDPEMRFTMPRASSQGSANFKSFSFFDRIHYRQLQGMDDVHPLLALRNFSNEYGSGEFPANAYARYLRRPLPRVRHQLLELTLEGFIFYDTGTDLIRVRDKMFDYLQANIRSIDYDIIDFSSTVQSPLENAILSLETHDVKINGIPQVIISNTQNVNIFPVNNTVTLKKNRNFQFDGNINAGNLSFFGTTFSFDYDDYRISLNDVDSISMRVPLEATDIYGRARLAGVRNLIRNVTGELYVDKPFNKSGRIDHPDYPKFSSSTNSYVFYDNREIQGGVYGQEDFFFELYPFVLDSLSSFRNDDLSFDGKLVSAGIFPDIGEKLILQEDFSLGIRHAASGGLPVYGGKGTWFEDILLDNSGLRGNGRLDYLSSSLFSENFLFLPDSLVAVTNDFLIEKSRGRSEFPAVRSRGNPVRWVPEKDLMMVQQGDEPFSLFENKAYLAGSLEISPSGLAGSGSLRIDNAEFTAEKYSFGAESFTTSRSRLIFHDPENRNATLSGNSLLASIDIEKQTGEFTRSHDSSPLLLPMNGFTTEPENFTWKMDEKEFEFFCSHLCPETGLEGAEYISTVSDKDSLRFISPHVKLDYGNHLLTASQVKYLEIADAMIIPNDEVLVIGESTEIAPLHQARIMAGAGRYSHEIYDAVVNIKNRNQYSGSGYYDYRDERDDVQSIFFSDITVTGDKETFASGSTEENDFMLSPWFVFSGETELLASRSHLNFRGATKIVHNCEGIDDQWLAFEHTADPMEILIPVPAQPLSADRTRIYPGIFIATDSVHIYPAFFSERKNYADLPIITADGYMKYDHHSGQYHIASLEKLRNPDMPGNYLRLDPKECILQGEGELELGVSFGQLGMEAFGTALNRVNENETSINGMVTLDFFFSEEAVALMTLNDGSTGSQPVDSAAWYYRMGLNELLGKERADNFRQSSGAKRAEELPGELQKTFVLSDVSLVWNKESRSYISQGKIGVAYINGVPVNRMLTGYLEITKRRSGDFIDLYIEPDDGNWYYFGYTRGTMQSFSSNQDFVNIINNIALRHRRDRGDRGQERYIYMVAPDTKLEQFFRTYRRNRDLGSF